MKLLYRLVRYRLVFHLYIICLFAYLFLSLFICLFTYLFIYLLIIPGPESKGHVPKWFLDRQRKHPQLRVWRTQFPLAPAFAITAHVAQGQTIPEGVLTDLCVGLGGNPFTAYVAFTRVKGREMLFIYRPFDAAPFQKGIGLGRDLLLRQLRGDRIDWKALLAKYCEERACSTCAERKPNTGFKAGQWRRNDGDRVCRECVKSYAAAGTPWQCNVCKRWHAEANFQEKHRQRQCSFYRVCLTCEMKKPCARCGIAKPEADFGVAAWKARHVERRCCRQCAAKLRHEWKCSCCAERKPQAEFTAWRGKRTYTQDGTQRCNACVSLALVGRFAARANQRLVRLRDRIQQTRQQASIDAVRQESATITAQDAKRREQTGPAATRTATSTAKDARRPEEVPAATRPGHGQSGANDAGPQEAGVAGAMSAPHGSTPSQPRAPGRSPEENNCKRFEYTCLFCNGVVRSRVRSGPVNHRKHCSKQFRVTDGRVRNKQMAYRCPFCDATVASSVMTGQMTIRACAATGSMSGTAGSATRPDSMHTHARNARQWFGQRAQQAGFTRNTRHQQDVRARGRDGTATGSKSGTALQRTAFLRI